MEKKGIFTIDGFELAYRIERLTDFDKPVFIGLGKYDYLVAPISLWESIDDICSHVKKVVFERSGHNPMFEESNSFDSNLIKD